MIWINQAGVAPRPHRVLPCGEPSIAVRRVLDIRGEIVSCELMICCQYTTACWHNPAPGEELIAVRLKPEMAAGSFGIDPVDYRDSQPLNIPLALHQQLNATMRLAEAGAEPHAVALSLIQDLEAAAHTGLNNTSFHLAAARLRDCHGALPVRELAGQMGVSARTLQRQFVDHLAVTPKFFARRLRLTRAAILSDHRPQVAWADVAAACGYHDQAHLIHEYQQLIGLTPSASHRERLGLSDFSNSITPSLT